MKRKKVLDLNAGLGGRVYAFEKAGFDVVGLIENDIENCQILNEFIDSEKIININLLKLDPSTLPDVDIIMAKYLQQAFSSIEKNRNKIDINYVIYNIISQKNPDMFLLEVPVSSIVNKRKELEKYMQEFIELGYDIYYKVYDEMSFSGYPVIGKQSYFIGKKQYINGVFEFPQVTYKEATKEIVYEDVNDINIWYRTVNFSTSEWKKESWYLKNFKDIEPVSYIHMGGTRENYLVDSLGPRRFTHNELAALKGLINLDYNKCANKRRMYKKIAYASNVYVVQAIADRMASFWQYEIQTKEVETIVDKTTDKKSKKKSTKIIFPKYYLKEINIKKLKGINNLELHFEKNLVALMGVNGSGKSTILHALACTYTRYEKGEDYKFSYFFTPNPDATWKDSSFTVVNYDENEGKENTKKYEKKEDRWARYSSRPIRDVFYLGITTCIPEIEIEKKTSFINYVSNYARGKYTDKIIADASYILQKDYEELMTHEANKKNYIGVYTKSGIAYSALSMGAGEQRIIKLLQTVYNAHQYSLILIDEIDLLLHSDAFRKLIRRLSEIATEKHLQIIFTTHSLEMKDLEEYADIRYIDHQGEKVLVYNTIKPDLLYELSGRRIRPYSIYVEDRLAASIIKKVAMDLHMQRHINVITYGSIENAFIVAAGKVLGREEINNVLIVTDGDKYVTDDEKKERLKKVLSGTEVGHEEKIEKALSIITQLNLPNNTPPEEYIHTMLISMDSDDECVECARRITSVMDSHDWIGEIEKEIGEGDLVYSNIMNIVAENENWEAYVQNVRNWLIEKRREV